MRALLLVSLIPLHAQAADAPEVVATYANIAEATFADSLTTAKALRTAVADLIRAPSDATLAAARAAWVAARVPYQQSEALRFGNPAVDDWEGRVNAWPLDEGLIDYTAPGTGGAAPLNVIANTRLDLGGTAVDATAITPALIAGTLHEAQGSEANVASGYHAIEFLLWGQDLNGTGPGAGARPFTDYVQGPGCTHGHCDRRAAYLAAATDLLVADLTEMTALWSDTGPARAALTRDPQAALAAMLTGMGSLSYGELAGERMKLGLMLNDPEEEQDCFSDNTPASHLNDAIGIRNVYLGRYTRTDGSTVAGPALSDLVAARDPETDRRLRAELDASVAAMAALGASGMAYDQMLAPGNARGAALVMAGVDALVAQTASITRAAGVLGLPMLRVEGSDSLDTPEAVFQ